MFTGDYYHETRAFFNRTDNTLLNIQNAQAEQGRRWEEQQKWNQEQATQMEGLRQDTATMNENISTMLRYWNIG